MTFELFEKNRKGGLSDNQISVSRTQISFGANIKEKFNKLGFVDLDRKNNKIGFRPTKSMITGFKVRRDRSLSFQSKSVCKIVPIGLYKAKQEDDIWVISVSKIKERGKEDV